MAQNEKSGAVKWLLIIVAAALLVFICWKAGWILNGKNAVSEQEKQEAIQEAVQEVNATMEAERSTAVDAEAEIQEVQEELQEVGEELRDAFKD